jgi:hypothetical protein
MPLVVCCISSAELSEGRGFKATDNKWHLAPAEIDVLGLAGLDFPLDTARLQRSILETFGEDNIVSLWKMRYQSRVPIKI